MRESGWWIERKKNRDEKNVLQRKKNRREKQG